MFTKILSTVILSLMLVFGPIGGAFATTRNDVTSGVRTSYKEKLEVQWVAWEDGRGETGRQEFLMIQDDIRVAQRLKYDGRPDGIITGLGLGDGTFLVYMQLPFGTYPLGRMSWEHILNYQPSWKILGDIVPTLFQTAMGFEDIYSYFEVSPEDIEKAVVMIRELNQKDLEQYEGDM
jgi:hypothetical protein